MSAAGRADVHIAQIVAELSRHNLLPAIVFRTSRNQCDVDAQRAATNRRMRLPIMQQRSLRAAVHEIIERYDMDRELITTHPQYNALVSTAIGAHHAGQLLMWRLLLEELMAAGQLKVLVATGTVAAGVDFPARTVIITAHSRRGAEGYRTLTSAEFQQMSGRAGRRGKDSVGFCIAAPSPFCDARQLLKISTRPPEPLTSSYFPSPSTVLNLLRYRNADDLRYTIERSLAAYVDRQESGSLRQQAEETLDSLSLQARRRLGPDISQEVSGEGLSKEERKSLKRYRRFLRNADELEHHQLALLDRALDGLRALNYMHGLSLSEKGFWAAHLCTTLVLELGELLESDLVEGVSAERLAMLVASICADDHRPYIRAKESPLPEEDFEQLQAILDRIGGLGIPGVMENRRAIPDASHTVLIWMMAESWQEFRGLLMLSGVQEGDAARLITQTADQLNQLTRLSETHSRIAYKAEEAKRRILRPPLTEEINLEAI